MSKPETTFLDAGKKVMADVAANVHIDPRSYQAVVSGLVKELEQRQRLYTELVHGLHDKICGQQAAYIEWKHGKGAEAAMAWVVNDLAGPGFIPDENAPWGKEAQAFFDANKVEPFPVCTCGRPSNILWMGKGFCCRAHCDAAEAEYKSTQTEETK